MGEIGGNDYNFWFFKPGNPRETPNQYMPDVVGHIGAAVQEVINLGAKAVLVPGNFPIGCVPQYLSMFQSNSHSDYDEHGCLVWFNDFSKKHNQLLQQEVARLRSQNPGVKIIYADYFGAATQFVQNPHSYCESSSMILMLPSCHGTDRFTDVNNLPFWDDDDVAGIDNPLVSCCGGDGQYHTGKGCDKAAKIWGRPGNFASWDGIHMTEKAYSIIAQGVLNGPYADTPLLKAC